MRRLLGALVTGGPCEQDAAWRRAESLLEDSLTRDQFDAYRSRGYVEVRSGLYPWRTYRIDGWRPVAVYEHGQFVGAVCIAPREHLPGPDVLLARKLMIEGAESEFLRAGNWLQPAWRPVGAAPMLFIIFASLIPWVLHLPQLGPWGVVTAAFLLAAPAGLLCSRRWRRQSGRRFGRSER